MLDFLKLRAFISGGEANVVDTCDALSNHLKRYKMQGDPIIPGFGMTETYTRSIYGKACPTYDLALGLELASVGSCIPVMHMRIIFDNDKDVLQGEAGSLQVRGDIVCQRCYNNELATVEAFTHDGWFITGDKAFIDAAGNLNLAGRAKRSIIINGLSVYPHQLESAIEDTGLDGVTPYFTAVFPHRPKDSETECFCVI